jgi:hypothetical protein
MNAGNRCLSLVVCALLSSLWGATAHAQGAFVVNNDTGVSVDLFVYRETLGTWTSIPVLRNDQQKVTPITRGNCYLVARSQVTGRDYHIGWYDLRSIAQRNPSPVLRLSRAMAMETMIMRGQPVQVSSPYIRAQWYGVQDEE